VSGAKTPKHTGHETAGPTSSGGVLRVDLADAGQREGTGAGQLHPQLKRAAHGLDEAAQGRDIEVGLAGDLEHRGLLDPETVRDLLLAMGNRNQRFSRPKAIASTLPWSLNSHIPRGEFERKYPSLTRLLRSQQVAFHHRGSPVTIMT
jgi:hypothetical protein